MRARILLTTAGAAALALAPAAQARTARIGSDLKAPATVAKAHPVDSAFWPAQRAGGPRIDVPFKGQATTFKLKGGIVAVQGFKPFDLLHFQVLRRAGGGRWRVVVTSEDFTAPLFTGPDAVHAFRSQFLCVRKGDRIALSNAGGYGDGYPKGVPFRTFGRVGGAATSSFTGAGRNMNGSVMKPKRLSGTELLVQATVVSGAKARPSCR